VNIDLSQLPHDKTQREVVETMIRKHEISNVLYSDEDEDTTRYIMQNPDDRRTCRRSQYNKGEIIDDFASGKGSTSPIELHQKILLGAKSNSIGYNTTSIELDKIHSNRQKDRKAVLEMLKDSEEAQKIYGINKDTFQKFIEDFPKFEALMECYTNKSSNSAKDKPNLNKEEMSENETRISDEAIDKLMINMNQKLECLEN
jgi:hypothetical protein